MLQKKRYIRKVLTKRLDKINEIVNGNKYEKKKSFWLLTRRIDKYKFEIYGITESKEFSFLFQKVTKKTSQFLS